MPIPEVDKIWFNGELVPWQRRPGARADPCPALRLRRLRGHPRLQHARGPRRVPPHRPPQAPGAFGEALLHAGAVHRGAALRRHLRRRAANGLDAGYIRPLVFRGYGEMGLFPLNAPVDAAIAVWPWGAYLGEEGIRHGIRVKVSSIQSPGPHGAGPRRQGHGPVPQQHPGQGRGHQRRLRRGHHAHRPRPRGRGLGRERLRGARRRAASRRRPATACSRASPATPCSRSPRPRASRPHERTLARSDLVMADELFFTGTAAEIVPIREVDDHEIGEPGPVTRASRSASAPSWRAATLSSATSWSSREAAEAHGRDAPGVQLYDTTLRDGMQQEGMSVSVDEKVRIALRLDELGVALHRGRLSVVATPRKPSSSGAWPANACARRSSWPSA